MFQRAPEGIHLHRGTAGPTSSYRHCFAQADFFLVPVITVKIQLRGLKFGGLDRDYCSFEKRGGESIAWSVLKMLPSPPVYSTSHHQACRAAGRAGGEPGRWDHTAKLPVPPAAPTAPLWCLPLLYTLLSARWLGLASNYTLFF